MTGKTRPELLLPAGNFEKMTYAFAFGADAVYLGVPQYSLRARENGFNKDSVVEAVNYGHRLGKKVYLTANVIPHNGKVVPFANYVDEFLSGCQPDGWIMSDPGMIMMMREKHPEQIIHLSVQANVVNYASAQFWRKIGVHRIILSREISLREIQEIRSHCPDVELEAFVHGSICVAYSGRCLISNYLSSRDPNQGTCSHSCRWEYTVRKKEEYVPLKGEYCLEEEKRPGEYLPIDEDENGTYLMNSRDLCAIELLGQLRDVGVQSFKVEGRSKSVYYAAMTARTYRNAVDDLVAGKPFNEENLKELHSTPNRGFTSGFLEGNPGHSGQKFDDSRVRRGDREFTGIARRYDTEKKWLEVEPRNPIRTGDTLEMLTKDGNRPLKVESLYNAKKHPIDIIHGGLQTCWIPCPEDPGDFVLFRI